MLYLAEIFYSILYIEDNFFVMWCNYFGLGLFLGNFIIEHSRPDRRFTISNMKLLSYICLLICLCVNDVILFFCFFFRVLKVLQIQDNVIKSIVQFVKSTFFGMRLTHICLCCGEEEKHHIYPYEIFLRIEFGFRFLSGIWISRDFYFLCVTLCFRI